MTFRGERHCIVLWVDTVASDAKLRKLIAELPDAEFGLGEWIVADVVVVGEPEDVPTFGGCAFRVDMLTVLA